MNTEQFQTMLADQGITLSSRQMDQYEVYFQTLVEWNQKMNLTAITEKNDVYLKHFYDSISAAFYIDLTEPLKLCDVGAGAGFPSIPLKIAFHGIQVTIVDSLNKRILFLEHLAQELGLEGVTLVHDRAETFGKNPKHREKYDIVTARAVARMSVLSELCLPLVKVGGQFVAMKAANTEDELREGKKAIGILGGKVDSVQSFLLPFEESERNIVLVKKEKPTPKKYPRKPGTPGKTPIR